MVSVVDSGLHFNNLTESIFSLQMDSIRQYKMHHMQATSTPGSQVLSHLCLFERYWLWWAILGTWLFSQFAKVASCVWCNITFINGPSLITLIVCINHNMSPQQFMKKVMNDFVSLNLLNYYLMLLICLVIIIVKFSW